MKEVILEDTVVYFLKNDVNKANELLQVYEPKQTKDEIKYLIKE